MALSDLTFKFWTDTGLTSAFSGLYQLVHQTDLSDNPQDFVLYFGSDETAGTRKVEATSNPGVDNITLTPTYILQEWDNATAYSLGDLAEPVTPNGFKYKITTAGTSGASEPTWPTTIGATVIDGTCVWECLSATHPITEIKLATSEAGLASATGGTSLNIGASIQSGSANKVAVWIRITNTVTSINSNTGFPELGLFINSIQETEV